MAELRKRAIAFLTKYLAIETPTSEQMAQANAALEVLNITTTRVTKVTN